MLVILERRLNIIGASALMPSKVFYENNGVPIILKLCRAGIKDEVILR